MFKELFDIATNADVEKITGTLASLNDGKRIRSISSMSSRSIFYFQMFVSDDHTAEEVEMIQKYAESNYAVMLAECFAQVPAIKVRPNDMNQISKFLDQFHQNIGSTATGSGESARRFISAVSFGQKNAKAIAGMFENAARVIESQWNSTKDFDNKEVKRLDESYVPLNDLFNEDALSGTDNYMVSLAKKREDELSTWGFVGESAPDDMFGFDMAYEEQDIPHADPVTKQVLPADTTVDADDVSEAANPIEKIKKTLVLRKGNKESKDMATPLSEFPKDIQIRILSDARARISNKIESAGIKGITVSKNGNGLFVISKDASKEDVLTLCDVASEFFVTAEPKGNGKIIYGVDTTPAVARKYGWTGNTAPAKATILKESTTKEAYSVLASKLDGIPDNKIKSAKNKSALRKMETKLKSMKNKYKKYLIRYKKKYEGSDNKKLSIRFEGMTIDDPKSFMKVYGEFIKVVNKKLALIEKRRAEIDKTTAKSVAETGSSPAWLNAPLEPCSLTDLDEMCMDTLEYVESIVNEMCDKPDSEVFIVDEANQGAIDKHSAAQQYVDAAVDKSVNRKLGKALSQGMSKMRDYNNKRIDDLREYNKAQFEKMRSGKKYSPLVNTGSMFTDTDIKKANDSLPTIIMVNVKMAVEGTDQVVDYTFPVGVKVHIHTVPWKELATDLASSISRGRKLLSFIKLTSGEESSMMDLLFGISKMKKEASDRGSKSSYRLYRSAIQRRKRLSKMSIPFITKNYTLNASIVLSNNVATEIKNITGLDIYDPKVVQKLMLEEFVFAMYMTDANSESCKAFYDNDLGYNEIPYKMMMRQQKAGEMEMRDLLRVLGTTQR